jgi:alpha-amylase
LGVLLQAFFYAPGVVAGVPSPVGGNPATPFWWDHLAAQAQMLRAAGFSAIWLPPPLKGASGSFSTGYDLFDDYDLGDKDQKGTRPTRYGSREQLERCTAVMRANGLDVYVDLVDNQRDGDDGHFNFRYNDASGRPGGGRFAKGPGDFHPHVPEDPGVFSDQFSFGRDLAPINGTPHDHCARGLLDAADWLTRSLDIQGYRIDNAKGVSTFFLTRLLNHGALVGKFAVAEFADGNLGLIRSWQDAVQHRAGAFDFPLHFMLKQMCNAPGSFDMSTLDHAGLAGVDPLGAVTFVENHDTDRGGIGGPTVSNKLLAYAYILTAEGYPCVFYRDYSHDPHCFGLKDPIDRLIWIHEHLAAGPTEQRWKDPGVFAYERTGGRRLLVGLNKDSGAERTIRVQTGFPPHTVLQDFAGHSPEVTTGADSMVVLSIPRNANGTGYVCYSRRAPITPFEVHTAPATQDYEGAADLDIGPAAEGGRKLVCRVFVKAASRVEARLFFNPAHWTNSTRIDVDAVGPEGQQLSSRKYDRGTADGASMQFAATATGFHSFFVQAVATPPEDKSPSFRLRVTYTAPQTL